MHACMHACMHARTHAHTHARTHALARVRACAQCRGASSRARPVLGGRRGGAPGALLRLQGACPRLAATPPCEPRARAVQRTLQGCVCAPARVRARTRRPSHPVGRLLPPVLGPSPFKSDMNKFVVITSCVVKPRCVGAQNYDSFRRKIHKLPNFCARRWQDCAARTVQARRDPSEPDHDCYHRVTI